MGPKKIRVTFTKPRVNTWQAKYQFAVIKYRRVCSICSVVVQMPLNIWLVTASVVVQGSLGARYSRDLNGDVMTPVVIKTTSRTQDATKIINAVRTWDLLTAIPLLIMSLV